MEHCRHCGQELSKHSKTRVCEDGRETFETSTYMLVKLCEQRRQDLAKANLTIEALLAQNLAMREQATQLKKELTDLTQTINGLVAQIAEYQS